jgi:hypothetical protein
MKYFAAMHFKKQFGLLIYELKRRGDWVTGFYDRMTYVISIISAYGNKKRLPAGNLFYEIKVVIIAFLKHHSYF